MTDLKARLAALPSYPANFTGDLGAANAMWQMATLRMQRDALSARVALLCEALRTLASCHERTPHGEPCICAAHEDARAILAACEQKP